jgi:hypothetical protein
MNKPSLIGGDGIKSAWAINFSMNFTLVLAFLVAGYIGDMIGTRINDTSKGFRYSLQSGAILIMITSIPSFYLISTRSIYCALLGQFILVIGISLYGGNLPAYMVSQFFINTRYSGIGIGKFCTISMTVFTAINYYQCIYNF